MQIQSPRIRATPKLRYFGEGEEDYEVPSNGYLPDPRSPMHKATLNPTIRVEKKDGLSYMTATQPGGYGQGNGRPLEHLGSGGRSKQMSSGSSPQLLQTLPLDKSKTYT